jgi:hypothetical protein
MDQLYRETPSPARLLPEQGSGSISELFTGQGFFGVLGLGASLVQDMKAPDAAVARGSGLDGGPDGEGRRAWQAAKMTSGVYMEGHDK